MKSGLDYFPLDVYLDDKFKLIEAEFGLTGFAIVVKLFQKIYGELGYYCEWTNEVALLFGRENCLGDSAVSEIVSAAIRRGIFDKKLAEQGILTSAGIQKRYFEAVSRRKEVKVKKEYLLIEVTQIYKNVDIIEENVNISSENADIFKQSKVKKSKVKKSKEIEVADAPFDFSVYTKNPELLAALHEFMQVRKKLKAVNSTYAIKYLLEQLDKIASSDVEKIEIVKTSIANGWKGVFPLKSNIKKRTVDKKQYMQGNKSYSDADLFPDLFGDTK